jgi:hypothetical protein
LGTLPTCQFNIGHHWDTHDCGHQDHNCAYHDDHNHDGDGDDDKDGDFLRCSLGTLC